MVCVRAVPNFKPGFGSRRRISPSCRDVFVIDTAQLAQIGDVALQEIECSTSACIAGS